MYIPKDYSHFSQDYYKTPPKLSRGELSQMETTLTPREAEAFIKIMKDGSAKPKIPIRRLPEYEEKNDAPS